MNLIRNSKSLMTLMTNDTYDTFPRIVGGAQEHTQGPVPAVIQRWQLLARYEVVAICDRPND